ncbi:metal ABC transporter ATP-binding protein [Exiguobacterium sp. RIT594]|uniref:metal ABC transporter ATP-binding protein n=1 Tax=Exiguobacterium sp. RIT594 TaxID=2282449 RepID=UPI000DF86656|nr:metal ABC transporter ATP-binding protein [Exiguobacterium sp. RIT594]RDB34767.1 metal ABC transporter ATP-binding protein [Exiguobacterium sp. RIT594]
MTEPIIEIKQLTYDYPDRRVLNEVTFNVQQGQFLAIVGENGSGKSTLIKCMLGLLKPKGSIRLFGQDQAAFSDWWRISYVSQKAASFNSGFPVTVAEVVEMGLYAKKGLFRRVTKQDRQKVKTALETVGMWDRRDSKVGDLSGGQQQRVFIARALVNDPDLMILDEPTVGVDQRYVKEFYEILEELRRDKKRTFVLVTHDIHFVSKLVTDVIHLVDGRLGCNCGIKEYWELDEQTIRSLYPVPGRVLVHQGEVVQ